VLSLSHSSPQKQKPITIPICAHILHNSIISHKIHRIVTYIESSNRTSTHSYAKRKSSAPFHSYIIFDRIGKVEVVAHNTTSICRVCRCILWIVVQCETRCENCYEIQRQKHPHIPQPATKKPNYRRYIPQAYTSHRYTKYTHTRNTKIRFKMSKKQIRKYIYTICIQCEREMCLTTVTVTVYVFRV